jgi:hypothetical protein
MNRENLIVALKEAIESVEFIGTRGDVVAIREAMSKIEDEDGISRFRKFIFIWSLREPVLIKAYCDANFDMTKIVETNVSYAFLPKLLISKHKPSNLINEWENEEATILELSSALFQCFGHGNKEPTISDHEQIVKIAKKLPNIGDYSSEHLFRSACLAMGKKHPAIDFVIMGSGANNTQYDKLKKLGFKNMTDVNKELENFIDAGELSYYICMAHLYKTV